MLSSEQSTTSYVTRSISLKQMTKVIANFPSGTINCIQQVIEIVRWEGFSGVVIRALTLFGIYIVNCYQRRICVNRNIPAVTDRCSILELSEAYATQYCTFRKGASERDFASRLANRARCFALIANDQIVSASWVRTEEAHLRTIALRIQLESHEIYIWDSYTSKRYRGRNYQSMIFQQISQIFSSAGYRTATTMVESRNKPNINSTTRRGFYPIGRIYCFRFKTIKCYKFRGLCKSLRIIEDTSR